MHDEERGTWSQWFQAADVRHVTALNGLLLEDGQLALTATLTGLGCSLLREPLVASHVASGELVKLFDLDVDDGRQYYLCRRSNSELSTEGINLYEWIKRSLVRG